ncbi:MAG: hypothetical protein HY744_27610 [Deltaproteobacteria bacterium]|nr:hypothetical protein [Deltaproteobacteria bacterium]
MITTEQAVRAYIEESSDDTLREILLTPQPQLNNHINDDVAPWDSPVWKWIGASGKFRSQAHLDLLNLVWDALRRQSPFGERLNESDSLLNQIQIRYVHLRGRTGVEVIGSIRSDTAEGLRRAGYPPDRLQVTVMEGHSCRARRLDFRRLKVPLSRESADSTMSLWDVLGSSWRYLDPESVVIWCQDSGLAAPVRRVEVAFKGTPLRVDVRTFEKHPNSLRRGCSTVEWHWPGDRDVLEVEEAIRVARLAGAPGRAGLEDLWVLRLAGHSGWTYVVDVCTGPVPSEDVTLTSEGVEERERNVVEAGFWDAESFDVAVPFAAIASSPAWRGDERRPPLGLKKAVDLSLVERRAVFGSASVSPVSVRVRRVGRDRWVYFVWVHPGVNVDLHVLSGHPFGVTMAGEVFRPKRVLQLQGLP